MFFIFYMNGNSFILWQVVYSDFIRAISFKNVNGG